jgi:phosphoglycolate phosphatase-like HAD superfamily hydrolase
MIDLSDYDYVVLDCDGVILDSNWLKTDAIIRTLKNEPEKCINKMIAYHKANGGISRYKKFRYYFEEINPHEDVEIKAKVSISKFAEIVQKGLLECDYIPGVVGFINNVKKKGIPLFVVSGSDEMELREVFSKRKIDSLFCAIYGSPLTKPQIMKNVISQVGQRKKGIFFGDSKADFDVAIQFELTFIFVSGVSEWEKGKNLFNGNLNYLIKDFQSSNIIKEF